MKRWPLRSTRAPASGFTLFEVLLVLVIVTVMAALALRGLRGLAKSDLRANTGKLSGAVRYLFDRASTTGKYHRLVIDIGEGRYWAEVSDDRFYVPREAETERDIKRRLERNERLDEEERRRAEEAEMSGNAFDLAKVKPQDFRPKRVRFAAFKVSALKPVTMKNTKVVDVYSPHLADLATAGRAYVYFFPLGQAEASIIHLSDPKGDTFYSLVIHPITGRVRIYNEYVKPPFQGRVDDEGTAVAP